MWVTELFRQTLMDSSSSGHVSKWSRKLIDLLGESKPDHEIHVLGISRKPRVPSFLVGSSSEKLPHGDAVQINLDEQVAQKLLASVDRGIRVFSEDLPMIAYYYINEGQSKREVRFYEAVCFDTPETSIVLGLTLIDQELPDFLPQEELMEMLPLFVNHAIPLFDLLATEILRQRAEEEIMAFTEVLRENNPEVQQTAVSELLSRNNQQNYQFGPKFLSYLMGELRTTCNQMEGCLNTSGVLGSAQPEAVASLRKTFQDHSRYMKQIANFASLAQPDVRPREGYYPMKNLVNELQHLASGFRAKYDVQIKVEEHTRNIFISGDEATQVKLCQQLMEFVLPHCAGGTLWIRTDDNSKVVDEGFALLEFEDSGEVPREIAPSALLDFNNLGELKHPRLENGGGILFQLLNVYLQKSKGRLQLSFGENNGFAVRMILPQVSRSVVHSMNFENPTG